MKRTRLIQVGGVTAVLAAVLLGACSNGTNDAGSSGSSETSGSGGGEAGQSLDDRAAADAQAAPESAVGNDGAALAAPGGATSVTVATADGSLLIRTANLTLRTDDVRAAVRDVEDLATSLLGTVTSAEVATNPDDEQDEGRASLTIRVPEERFRDALRSLGALGDVLDQREDATDVTTEVVDVDARVKSQQASVERVRALLAKATSIGEVVSIEAELARREADLDSLLARQAALADQTARATISVQLVGPATVVVEEEEPERGFLYGLERGWDAFVAAGAVLLTMLGALLPFAAVALVALAITLASLRARARRSA